MNRGTKEQGACQNDDLRVKGIIRNPGVARVRIGLGQMIRLGCERRGSTWRGCPVLSGGPRLQRPLHHGPSLNLTKFVILKNLRGGHKRR
jgi:hypothetical protein